MEKHVPHKVLLFVLGVVLFYSCSPVKYVPEKEYLLDKVTLKTDTKGVSKSEIKRNIRQRPNTRILGVLRFHLGLYNLSGKNGEKRFNKWLRSIGAVSGLRLDASFFLLRFDWGIKMRDPSKPENKRFVLVDNGRWMRHTVFNIAIGYPF